uniref:Uncharacterized protein n=1 Tax=Arundo donax TaxID=35708 RepID=A0A0A9FTN8_ARUDO
MTLYKAWHSPDQRRTSHDIASRDGRGDCHDPIQGMTLPRSA